MTDRRSVPLKPDQQVLLAALTALRIYGEDLETIVGDRLTALRFAGDEKNFRAWHAIERKALQLLATWELQMLRTHRMWRDDADRSHG